MFTRYTSHGSVQDLQDIIALHRRALASMSSRDARYFASLNHLAEALCERWYQLTQKNDIKESIALFEEALALCANCDENRAIVLGNLAQALMYLNMRNTEASRYSSAISLLREALSISPLHNDVSAILNARLGYAVQEYYSYTRGEVNDLHEALDICRNAVNLLHIGHRDRAEALLSLAQVLKHIDAREIGTEARNYGEELRLVYRRALDAQSSTHPRRARCLSALGWSLVGAYHRLRGSKADLDEGIRLTREAIALVTPSHIDYPHVLGRLATGLAIRFSHFHQIREDIDYSIILQDQLMSAGALLNANRFTHVHNLAESLEIRYQHFKNPADLSRAISLGREALVLCPPRHPEHRYSVLMLSLRLILDINCSIAHLDEMVGLLQAVLEDEYKPEANRSGKSVLLCAMARLLHTRFLRLSDPKDQARFAELFEAAVLDQYSSFATRFKSAKQWISAAESVGSPEMAMKAYRMAIYISPYRVYPGLDLSSQLDQLKRDFATISCDAACLALITSDALEALTLLEQGRATFWAQRLQLRMSLDALPLDLAERLRSATKNLQECHSLKKDQNASGEQRSLDQRLYHETFLQLVQEARLHPDFTDFLRPIQIEQLAGLAEEGILIVLLSSKTYGSFAIIIRDRSPNVEKVPLLSITADDLQAMVEEFQASVSWARQEMRNAVNEGHRRLKVNKGQSISKRKPSAMARLWSTVGEPIMRHLGIEVSAQQRQNVSELTTQTVCSGVRRLTPGHEYGGAVPVLLRPCPSMQLDYQNPNQYICQTTLSRHMHQLSVALSRQENRQLLLQQRLR
jgi:tetratricopeptide (TPR) repeat protein